MGKPEIEAFLSHLVMKRNVASSTQNQAFNAILFLYNNVIDTDMPQDINSLRSKKPIRLPTVMTREETLNLIRSMHGTHQLMAKLMYGSGLRVMECIRLRIKDVDHAMNQIIVRDGYDIRTVQELLGHKDVSTTMIYTHVLNRGGRGVKSPLDIRV
jgi:site-specific recombinase XerD